MRSANSALARSARSVSAVEGEAVEALAAGRSAASLTPFRSTVTPISPRRGSFSRSELVTQGPDFESHRDPGLLERFLSQDAD